MRRQQAEAECEHVKTQAQAKRELTKTLAKAKEHRLQLQRTITDAGEAFENLHRCPQPLFAQTSLSHLSSIAGMIYIGEAYHKKGTAGPQKNGLQHLVSL